MSFWKKSHGLTMPDGWFLKHCKTQHATSTREEPGRSHADTKSLSNPGSASSSQHTMVALSHMDSFVQGQQVRQSKQANVMAVPQAVCKQKSEARQQHVLSYHKANYGFKGRSDRNCCDLGWAVSCQHQAPDGNGSSSYMWVTRDGTYRQERLWPPPFLTNLGLDLGFDICNAQTGKFSLVASALQYR